MANNRELLKEALADAKSLREMAITNAKAALEESFTPQIKTMLSAKLEEMEKEDMNEEMSKKYMEDDKMEEVEKDEMKEEKEEKMEEDLNLDEILAELEEADDSDEKEPVKEVDEVETEETEEEGEMEDGESDEPMDLEDMSEDDLKGFIESVIADMVEAGDLEAGEDMEDKDMEDGMEDEMEDEEEVNIDELLAEIESMDEEYKYEEDDKDSKMEEMSTKYEEDDSKVDEMYKSYEEDDKDSMNEGELTENFLNRIAGKLTGETKSRIESIAGKITAGKKLFGSEFVEPTKEEMEAMVTAIKKDGGAGTVAVDKSTKKVFYTPAKDAKASGPSVVSIARESLQTELNEALEANKVLSTELNEVNLLNAKLLYTNRIFKAKNLTESQKVKVLSTFDKASNVNEVELVYETLNDTTFKSSKKSINENLGSASRTMGTTKTTKPIIETNDAYKRMQELAFYDVKH